MLHVRHGAPTFAHITKDPAVKQQRVTVYWAGMQVDGELHSLPLQPLWLEYGDVLIVKYDPRLVSRSKVSKATYRKLRELGYGSGKDVLDAFAAPVTHLHTVRSPYPDLTPLHASFREFPEAWRNAQREVYDELYATA